MIRIGFRCSLILFFLVKHGICRYSCMYLLDLFYPTIFAYFCQFAWPTPSVWMILAERCFPVLLHLILRTTTALQHEMSLILCGQIEVLREATC